MDESSSTSTSRGGSSTNNAVDHPSHHHLLPMSLGNMVVGNGNFEFDVSDWTTVPHQSTNHSLLVSPGFPSSSTVPSESDLLFSVPPSWQLDHAPSWQPDPLSPGFPTYLNPLNAPPSLSLSSPSTTSTVNVGPGVAPTGTTSQSATSTTNGTGRTGLGTTTTTTDDFGGGNFFGLLGSPTGGEQVGLKEEPGLVATTTTTTFGEETESSSDDDSEEEEEEEDDDESDEEDPTPLLITPGVEQSVVAAIEASLPLMLTQEEVDRLSHGQQQQQQHFNPSSIFSSSTGLDHHQLQQHQHYPSPRDFIKTEHADTTFDFGTTSVGYQHFDHHHHHHQHHDDEDDDDDDDDEEDEEDGHGGQGGAQDEYTPPTSNSSEKEHSHSPLDEPPPFIPALSHPRSAHLRTAYANEDGLGVGGGGEMETEFGSGGSGGGRKRKRSTSTQAIASTSMNWASPPPQSYLPTTVATLADFHSHPHPHPPPSTTTNRATSVAASTTSSISATGSTKSQSRNKAPKKPRQPTPHSGPSFPVSSDILLSSSTGLPLKRTEIPAVAEDPSIKPYGCNFSKCPARLRAKGKAKRREMGLWEPGDDDEEGGGGGGEREGEEMSFRTIKELREHTAGHKKMGLTANDTPFRCALDPCGKTFKSLAGLRFHFQNASANGHFFVSKEEGETVATKKFKLCVQPSERSEKCPIRGCSKAFKQAAGLAYHLAHTANHDISEELLLTFSSTLQSKTRWWFTKTGRTFCDEGGGAPIGPASDEEEGSDED